MSKYGLSKKQAGESLARYGRNILPEPTRKSFWQLLRKNSADPIMRVLLMALLVNIIFVYAGQGDWLETAGIFLAIGL